MDPHSKCAAQNSIDDIALVVALLTKIWKWWNTISNNNEYYKSIKPYGELKMYLDVFVKYKVKRFIEWK